jgi:hypothetical protein
MLLKVWWTGGALLAGPFNTKNYMVIYKFWKLFLLLDKVVDDLKSQFRRHKKKSEKE